MKKVFIILMTVTISIVLYVIISKAGADSYKVYSNNNDLVYKDTEGIVNIVYNNKEEQALHFENGVTLYKKIIVNKMPIIHSDFVSQYFWFENEFLAQGEGLCCAILCPSKKHILWVLPMFNSYIAKNPYKLNLEKFRDYKNVTSYKLSFEYEEFDHSSDTIIWLAKEDDQYCGGAEFYPLPLNIEKITEEDEKFYSYIGDAFIDLSNYVIGEGNKALDNYTEIYTLSSWWFYPTYSSYVPYITLHDKQAGDELSSKYENLINRLIKYRKNGQINNQSALSNYSNPLVQIKHKLANSDEDRSTLPLQGKLPKTEEELKIYIAIADKRINRTPDFYGEPVKFVLEKEGLRVSSAGLDKKWNTADDQTFLRKYSEEK